jgi:hypothetical protein
MMLAGNSIGQVIDRMMKSRLRNRRRIMLSKPGIILYGATTLALLGGSLPVQAFFYAHEENGVPHQTWCNVNPDCNGWNKRLHGTTQQSNAFGAKAPVSSKQRPSHKRSQPDPKDR